ncbi:unnamed protein product [Candidula unifasciata]|uniref:Direct IAP-binding protein with low pI n=1 Tax=Candidula unifasciata TaxID=100452 RepID=A0A8S3ZY96_9EUPU|nr:unnamed protein product [Candidula unifasciata]
MFSLFSNLYWPAFANMNRFRSIRHPVAKYVQLLSFGGAQTLLAQPFMYTESKEATRSENSHHLPNRPVYSSSSEALTFEPDDPRLRSSECLKNAAGLAVDSTSAILSQTVYTVINIEEQYVELVNRLILLLELQLQVLGLGAEEEKVADLILQTRHEISQVYKRKQDLVILFDSVEKLAVTTAEVAFAAGATYASTSIGERLYSAVREIQQLRATSDEADKNLRSVEVQSIEVMTKHEQNKEVHDRANKT